MARKNGEKKEKCVCGNTLWVWLDDSNIKILGQNGQDYEVCFNTILLTCQKCGAKHSVSSDIAETIQDLFVETSGAMQGFRSSVMQMNPYARITNVQRNKILKSLSEKQKEIFKLMLEMEMRGSLLNNLQIEDTLGENGEAHRQLTDIIDKIVLPKDIVIKNIGHIEKEIRKLIPSFGHRNLELYDKTIR